MSKNIDWFLVSQFDNLKQLEPLWQFITGLQGRKHTNMETTWYRFAHFSILTQTDRKKQYATLKRWIKCTTGNIHWWSMTSPSPPWRGQRCLCWGAGPALWSGRGPLSPWQSQSLPPSHTWQDRTYRSPQESSCLKISQMDNF